jgi:hypothetical protein
MNYLFQNKQQEKYNAFVTEYANRPIPDKTIASIESDLTEIDYEKVSDIKVTFRTGVSRVKHATILVVSFIGNYNIGAMGNDDAEYMFAKLEFGMFMSGASAIIIDFRQLNYVWGDMIEAVSCPAINRRIPVACVLGDGCREAYGTLIHGVDSKEPATTEEEIFDDFYKAWQYIEEQLDIALVRKSDPRH